MLNTSLADGLTAAHALVYKRGAQPAVKVSGAAAGLMSRNVAGSASAFDVAAQCPRAHVVGWESVTVPAGTFRTLHLTTDVGGEIWGSRDIPFGLVKTHGKLNMALTGHGMDAKSSLNEKPIEMPGFMTKP